MSNAYYMREDRAWEPVPSSLVGADEALGQEGPNGADDGEGARDSDEKVIKGSFAGRDIFAEEFEVEREREADAEGLLVSAQCRLRC